MTKIAFVIYRKWAFEIFKGTKNFSDIPVLITTKECEFKNELKSLKSVKFYKVDGSDNDKILEILDKNKIDVALFYGWSWIVKKKILDKYLNFCLHPSLLPKYRGGTPIQHQLISNEKESAVTVFKMTEGIDDGEIYKQEKMSLIGNVEDIFKRVIDLGIIITEELIIDIDNDELELKKQKNPEKFPPLKRRTPDMSEIKFDELGKTTFKQLHNLIRGLRDPFPNTFIRFKSFTLNILAIRKYKKIPVQGLLLSRDIDKNHLQESAVFLKLKDSFARVEEFRIL